MRQQDLLGRASPAARSGETAGCMRSSYNWRREQLGCVQLGCVQLDSADRRVQRPWRARHHEPTDRRPGNSTGVGTCSRPSFLNPGSPARTELERWLHIEIAHHELVPARAPLCWADSRIARTRSLSLLPKLSSVPTPSCVESATPYEYICKIWTIEPERFTHDPTHHMPGLNT